MVIRKEVDGTSSVYKNLSSSTPTNKTRPNQLKDLAAEARLT